MDAMDVLEEWSANPVAVYIINHAAYLYALSNYMQKRDEHSLNLIVAYLVAQKQTLTRVPDCLLCDAPHNADQFDVVVIMTQNNDDIVQRYIHTYVCDDCTEKHYDDLPSAVLDAIAVQAECDITVLDASGNYGHA